MCIRDRRCAALDGGGGEVASWSAVQGAEGGAVEVAATERQRSGDSATVEHVEGGAVVAADHSLRLGLLRASRRYWVPSLCVLVVSYPERWPPPPLSKKQRGGVPSLCVLVLSYPEGWHPPCRC